MSEFSIGEEEQQIIDAKNNQEKFSVLYNKYYSSIVKFVFTRVATKEDAFDITQQVFVKAMQQIQKYEYKGLPFSSWLYRIAINELNMMFRKEKIVRVFTVNYHQLQDISQEIELETKEEEIDRILNALILLSEEDYQIIEMRFFEKRAFKEIGEILSITENNAKVKLYRIIEKLQKQLKIVK